MRQLATEGSTAELCRLFEVSRSGYYAWQRRGRSARQRANEGLSERIREVHAHSRQTYGSPRITEALRAEGIRCGQNRVARLMKALGLRGLQKRRYRPRTTDSRHAYPLSPNRLQRGHRVEQPNQVWVADITYIATRQGWMYLSAVMDLATRQIKGWALKDTLQTELASQAFLQAVHQHSPASGLIHHSDRGCQYASEAYRILLSEHRVLSSMGRTGNCYDNAAMESFWATLKNELLRGQPLGTPEQLKLALFDYIEIFYNRQRLHSALGYRPPAVFEAQWRSQNSGPQVSIKSG